MIGYEVFPYLDSDKDDEEVERRFQGGQSPIDPQLRSTITSKCWMQESSSAEEVVDDSAADGC